MGHSHSSGSPSPPSSVTSGNGTSSQLSPGGGRGYRSLPYPLQKKDGKMHYECKRLLQDFRPSCPTWRCIWGHTRARDRLKCNLCTKSFTQLAHLQKHDLVHTGEKPHLCDVCNKRFSSTSNLKTHLRLHSGQKAVPLRSLSRPNLLSLSTWSFTKGSTPMSVPTLVRHATRSTSRLPASEPTGRPHPASRTPYATSWTETGVIPPSVSSIRVANHRWTRTSVMDTSPHLLMSHETSSGSQNFISINIITVASEMIRIIVIIFFVNLLESTPLSQAFTFPTIHYYIHPTHILLTIGLIFIYYYLYNLKINYTKNEQSYRKLHF